MRLSCCVLFVCLGVDLPKEQAPLLEQYVLETYDHHTNALKCAVFDYVYRDPHEQQRLQHLRLPPPKQPAPVPEYVIASIGLSWFAFRPALACSGSRH